MSQIKKRLKDAYENVEFHASNTWVFTAHAYHKANQELYVRENKIRDKLADEHSRSRTVQDCIPQSKLAQYANYEYNEARELSYTSSTTDVSFFYPCASEKSSITEPWMIPEIEQLFIHFMYPPDFNILEVLRLENLEHLDEHGTLKIQTKPDPTNRRSYFHEISPILYETVERTPGKSRYTTLEPISEKDISMFTPQLMKIETFDDTILRMKIKSEKIKYLWSDHSRPISESFLKPAVDNNLKSPVDHFHFLEGPPCHVHSETCPCCNKEHLPNTKSPAYSNNLIQQHDFKQLQHLADSIGALNDTLSRKLESETYLPNKYDSTEAPRVVSKSESTPTRRLYSAVLQGLTTTKKGPNTSDVTSTSSSSAKEPSSSTSPSKTVISSCLSRENSSMVALSPVYKSTPNFKSRTSCVNSLSEWIIQPSCSTINNSPTKSYVDVNNQDRMKAASHQLNVSSSTSCAKTETTFKFSNVSPNTTISNSYADTPNTNNQTINYPCPPANVTNMPSYSSSSNAYFGNSYPGNNTYFCNNNSMYAANNHFNNLPVNVNCQYNFSNNSYTSTSGTQFSTNNVYTNNSYQGAPLNSRCFLQGNNRQQYPSSPSHISTPHPMWFLHHNRPSAAVYSVAHFATQPYLFVPSQPQPPPPQSPPAPLQSTQNQRWTTPITHYVRPQAPSLPSYPMPPPSPSSSYHQQKWGIQNQNLHRAKSNQHITTSALIENAHANVRSKPGKCESLAYTRKMQCNLRSRSPCSSISSDNFDRGSSATHSNTAVSYSKRSTRSYEVYPSEKHRLVKSAASTSSLEYRRSKIYKEYNYINSEPFVGDDTRLFPTICNCQDEITISTSSESEDTESTLLHVSVTISEELERQALEQYQPSDENFYQELERQAKEQYDEDHSENWIGPPKEDLHIGGQTIRRLLAITKNSFFLFLVVYVDINVCNYCLFLLS